MWQVCCSSLRIAFVQKLLLATCSQILTSQYVEVFDEEMRRRRGTTLRCACPMECTGSLKAAGTTSIMPLITAVCSAML